MKGLGRAAFVLLFLVGRAILCAAETSPRNLVPNGDFSGAVTGDVPEGWAFHSPRSCLAPRFGVATEGKRRSLLISGSGKADSVGWASAGVRIARGTTYWLRVRFRKSEAINPLQHLMFAVATDEGMQGIAEFHRLKNDLVEAEGRIRFPGEGAVRAEVRLFYQLCANGSAWIENVSLTETTPLPPRWVRVACTQGPDTLEEYRLKAFGKMLDAAGEGKADLVLLPEYVAGEGATEPVSGPSAQLMSQKAKKYRMYVAGTIGRSDPTTDRLYNSALLFDRHGKQIGCYDKVHLYGPEMHDQGITPGERVAVFETDFGKVGFMTCYDSWFSDVVELVALKGADILLFPNLGYDRELMHARALDNAINVVTSSRSGGYGVWDAQGRDVLRAAIESKQDSSFKDVVQLKVADGGVLLTTVNLNAPATLEMSGGTLVPVLRGRRHLSNQRAWLEDEIKQEKARWWTE